MPFYYNTQFPVFVTYCYSLIFLRNKMLLIRATAANGRQEADVCVL